MAPDDHRRLFTIAEANAAIPDIAARMLRLQALRDEIRRGREFLDILWGRLEAGEAVLTAIGERQAALEKLGEQFAQSVGDLEAAGVVVRDLDPALVDFPSQVRGIPIYLCWRAGEPCIAYWHGQGDGFAGRKPISTIEEMPRSN